MKFQNRIRWILDNCFKGYYLEKYILKDGHRHPLAIICPGGGYHRVCSFIEGLPYAKKLNDMGYKNYNLPKPGALILSYPVVTMGKFAHEGSRNYLLGSHPSAEQIEFASVEKQLTDDYVPTFLWCGLEDHTVDPKNSYLLKDALIKHGIPHCFLPINNVDHGVGIGEGLECEGWFEKAVQFWENNRRI